MKKASIASTISVPTTEIKTLKNGVQITFVDAPHSPVADVRFIFDAGYKNVKLEEHHVPHMLEHVIMESKVEKKTLASRVMQFGADANAITGFDELTVLVQGPVVFATDYVREVIATLRGLSISEQLVERERRVIRREVAEQHDGLAQEAGSFLLADLMPDVFPGGAAAQEEGVNAIETRQVEAFNESHFQKCGLQILIVGALSKTTKTDIQKIIEALPSRAEYVKPAQATIEQGVHIEALPVVPGGAFVTLSFISATQETEHSRKLGAAEMYMIGRYFSGAHAGAMKELRDSGLVYDLNVDGSRFGSTVYRNFSLTTDNGKERKSLVALLDVFFEIMSDKDDDEFKLVKQYIRHSSTTAHESVGSIAEWYQQDLIACRPLWHIADQEHLIASLKQDDIRQAVFEMITQSRWQVAMPSNIWGSIFFESLADLRSACAEAKTPQECLELYLKWRKHVDLEGEVLTEPRYKAFSWLVTGGALASMGLFFLPYLPPMHGGKLLSMFDIALEHHYWGLIMAYCTVGLLFLPRKNAFEGMERSVSNLLAALGAMGAYIYMFTVYTSDLGTDNAPWIEDMASIIHPVFFLGFMLVVVVLAIKSIVILKRKQQGEKVYKEMAAMRQSFNK